MANAQPRFLRKVRGKLQNAGTIPGLSDDLKYSSVDISTRQRLYPASSSSYLSAATSTVAREKTDATIWHNVPRIIASNDEREREREQAERRRIAAAKVTELRHIVIRRLCMNYTWLCDRTRARLSIRRRGRISRCGVTRENVNATYGGFSTSMAEKFSTRRLSGRITRGWATCGRDSRARRNRIYFIELTSCH